MYKIYEEKESGIPCLWYLPCYMRQELEINHDPSFLQVQPTQKYPDIPKPMESWKMTQHVISVRKQNKKTPKPHPSQRKENKKTQALLRCFL